jgi:hypothetical protein
MVFVSSVSAVRLSLSLAGDVMYLEVLGNPIIVLNTEQVAAELLNKRSAIYSDRPQFILYEMSASNSFGSSRTH